MGGIFVRDPAPPGDPNLDEALTGLAASRGVPVGEWMADIPAGIVTAYFERLEAAGVLRNRATLDDPFRHAAQAAVHSAVHHSVHAAVSAATTTSHHSGGSSSGSDSSPAHHHH